MNSRVPSGGLAAWAIAAWIAVAQPVAAHAPVPAGQRSCKPMAPVQLLLEPGSQPNSWRIQIQAQDATRDVAISLREDLRPARPVWRGALRAGETRTFEVSHAPSSTAAALCAEAVVTSTPTLTLRAEAAIRLAGGKPAPAVRAKPSGRLVESPDGPPVLELPGATGSRR